jgi:hypothetical protein
MVFSSGLETEINGRGNLLRWPRNTLYPQKLALTSPTSGGRSVDIVRLRFKATGFIIIYGLLLQSNYTFFIKHVFLALYYQNSGHAFFATRQSSVNNKSLFLNKSIATCMGYVINNRGFRIRWIDLFSTSPIVTTLCYHYFQIAVTITQTIITLSGCDKVFDCWTTFNDVFTTD